jgi:acetoin utilization protein AcuB
VIAQDYIQHIPAISLQSKRDECINLMLQNRAFELPVLNEGRLWGTITLDACIFSEEESIENLAEPGFASVHSNTHLFDVMHVLDESHHESVAVLNYNLEFEGILTHTRVLEGLAQGLSIEQAGAVVLIEISSNMYSSSELTRLIESEGAQVLGLWVNSVPESGRIRISLKLNTTNAERVMNSLQRFNYEVVSTFGDDDYKEHVEKRYQSLMKYLDI